jgi:hypothetical protein
LLLFTNSLTAKMRRSIEVIYYSYLKSTTHATIVQCILLDRGLACRTKYSEFATVHVRNTTLLLLIRSLRFHGILSHHLREQPFQDVSSSSSLPPSSSVTSLYSKLTLYTKLQPGHCTKSTHSSSSDISGSCEGWISWPHWH